MSREMLAHVCRRDWNSPQSKQQYQRTFTGIIIAYEPVVTAYVVADSLTYCVASLPRQSVFVSG